MLRIYGTNEKRFIKPNENITILWDSSIIPDIESVNYGRNVGYEIIEHKPPTKIKKVSATKIRQKLRKSGKL